MPATITATPPPLSGTAVRRPSAAPAPYDVVALTEPIDMTALLREQEAHRA
jgi:hypothetical protein